MVHTTVISNQELANHIEDDQWRFIDCRFVLNDPAAGRALYAESHLPGAVYAHLDDDLSNPVVPGQTGRHPLPDLDHFAQQCSQWGIGEGIQVVAYDAMGGAMAAARLWWLLRYLGHEAVAVLDGGWQAWTGAGLPVSSDAVSPSAQPFSPRIRSDMVAEATDLEGHLGDGTWCICDSRSADRYRGENETIDPVAGHIPSAISVPFADNWNESQHFKSSTELQDRFAGLIGSTSPEQTVFYCGSGVTAAHNVLACAYAGLGMTKLYPGSWSEWITDSQRPIVT